MILSVSRRTDIPSFYSEWFFNRIKEGYVYVINPFNRKQVSKVSLRAEDVDCIVFWTKDPKPMLNRLRELKDYKYYFQFTITSYRKDIETNLRPKKELIKTFKDLSEAIGKEKVIWRYDPILLNDFYTKEYHYEWFERFMQELSPYTERCVISFIDFYKKTERSIKHLNIKQFNEEDIYEMAEVLSKISRGYGITLEACSEKFDLSKVGINPTKCIDDRLISKIIGADINVKKDPTQREECGCVKSVDIGQYNTCIHGCAYCYANFDHEKAKLNYKNHNCNYPLLSGELLGDEKITVKKAEHLEKKEVEIIQESFKI